MRSILLILNLSIKIKKRNSHNNFSSKDENVQRKISYNSKRLKFRSLVLDKNFEAAKNISLEELNENTCKYMEGHPDQKDSNFCGRKTVEKFSYCPLHLMIVYQPKGKRDDVALKEDEVPAFIEKKVKSA